MNDLELLFNMLGEAATTEIAQARDAQGFDRNKDAAVEGGEIAGKSRKELEAKTGRRVVSPGNYLPDDTDRKRAIFKRSRKRD